MPFRMYIDESGDHTFKHLEDNSRRYLSLTGVIIEDEHYRKSFHPEFEQLKQQHFPHDPDQPLILHRSDIINRKGLFRILSDPLKDKTFTEHMMNFLSRQNFRLITVVIDKKAHVERYGDAAFHPYHYCLSALLERYCGFLNNVVGQRGDVLAESRGKKENLLLMAAYEEVLTVGTLHRNNSFFRQAVSSKNLKLKPKTANIAGLQVADLLAYSLKEEILEMEGRLQKKRTEFNRCLCNSVSQQHNMRWNSDCPWLRASLYKMKNRLFSRLFTLTHTSHPPPINGLT